MRNMRTWGGADAPLLLLLHAQGCHSGWWDWAGPLLAERYQVVAPDLRGHGKSPRASDGDYRFAAYARDIEALVAHLGGGPYAIVGHSMGAYIGLLMAAQSSTPPAALVIADMKTDATEQELADLQAAATRPARPFPSLADAVGRYRLAPPEHAVPADRLAAVAAASYHQADDGQWHSRFDRRALAIEPLSPVALAAKVKCPALVMRGEHSSIMPQAPAMALADQLNAQCVELPGCYHHLPLEAPEAFAGHVLAFLPR